MTDSPDLVKVKEVDSIYEIHCPFCGQFHKIRCRYEIYWWADRNMYVAKKKLGEYYPCKEKP